MTDSLLRTDEKLSGLDLPELHSIPCPQILPGQIYILACGFEDRTSAFLEEALANGSTNFRIIAIEYQPYFKENKKSDLLGLCQCAGIDPIWIKYDRGNPAGIGDQVLSQINDDSSLKIDISGMSKLLIVQLLVSFGRRSISYANCEIIYAEADQYPPSQKGFESKLSSASELESKSGLGPVFISWGVQALAITPELTSPPMTGIPVRLIAFPSFNRVQLKHPVDELQPTHVDLIDGIPPQNINKWRINAIKKINDKTIRSIPNKKAHQTSTLHYQETLRQLLKLYVEHSAFDKLVISPTGSKMQSVAVGIVVAYLPGFQVVYPTPLSFADMESHTVGVAKYHGLSLDNICLS